MNYERLRKKHKKGIVITTMAICAVGGALTYATSRAKYQSAESIPLARGTVNYKAHDFRIMAMYKSDDKTNYTEIDIMPESGYAINESKSYCNMSNGNKNTDAVLKTVDGNHVISKLKKNDRCYLYFDKYVAPKSMDEIIASLDYKTNTPNFDEPATTDEGVYKIEDGMYGGTSYYWRGAATTNHVIFANKCWRIVRINGDSSMRIIYNGEIQSGNTCTGNGTNNNSIAVSGAYNTNIDRSEYVGWTYTLGSQRTLSGTDSNAKAQAEKWYIENIKNNAKYNSKVADGKFCNDRNATSWNSQPSSSFYYAGYSRINSSNITPSLSCNTGDTYNLKIGIITADEVVMAGSGKYGNHGVQVHYLNNGTGYWTMTPYMYYVNGSINTQVLSVTSWGNLNNTVISSSGGNIRPVINLKADTQFEGNSDGTQSNPYVVS